MLLHASHNLWIQGFFDRITTEVRGGAGADGDGGRVRLLAAAAPARRRRDLVAWTGVTARQRW
jgi:hypothetical protein